MSEPRSPSKIVLPTPETCPWRSSLGEGRAHCGLLASLLGTSEGCHVSDEQCHACCQTFPPTPTRLNPVVGSLLYTRLAEMRAAKGGDLDGERMDRLTSLAERALQDEEWCGEAQLPLRAVEPCCFLGPACESTADKSMTEGKQRSQTLDQPTYVCHHPRHDLTTVAQCGRCYDWSVEPTRLSRLKLREIVPSRPTNDAVQYWAVGVTTSPRTQPTLQTCVDALQRSGWGEIHLFLDGSVRVPRHLARLPTTWREQRVGACPAWYLSLAELVAIHPEADAFAIFQDDAYVHDRESLREYLEETLWKEQGRSLVSLYNPGVFETCGWHRMPTDWDWGSLAVIFPADVARLFLSDPAVMRRSLPQRNGQHRPIPELIREWTHRRGIDVWCPYPSLVQHIGSTSSIWKRPGMGRNRTAPWFSGDLEQPFYPGQSLADFPESVFPCDEGDRVRYEEKVALGTVRMREAKVVIAGTARDVAPHLPRTIARIERLGAMFGEYRVVVVENDSSDRTLPLLLQWASSNHRVKVLSDRLGLPRFPQARSLERAAAMAEYRNRYLQDLQSDCESWTHVIAVDMDLVGGWSYEGIANTFGYDDWDFVGSYGLDHFPTPPQQPPRRWHYDSWAFRAAKTSAARVLLKHRGDSLRRGMPLLQVESCFGGLGVYRFACLRECRYGGADCEHVVLHRNMRDAGFSKQFLNPSQIVVRSALVP